MNIDSEVAAFSELPTLDKAALLARVIHELTVEARETYGPTLDAIADQSLLRVLNEIQYRVSGFLVQLLDDDPSRHSDDAFLRLILGPRPNKALEQVVRRAWRHAVSEDRTLW